MELPAELLVKKVDGTDDTCSFVVDLGFTRDEKAFTEDEFAPFKNQLEEGDLLISGWGANFEVDRQDEAFEENAFDRGLKAFLDGEATLAYHHKADVILGKVLHAERVAGKGVRLIARVDNQPQSSPVRHLYEQVKKGTLNALSCAGLFKRRLTENGPRICDVDLTEWSITGVPVGKGTNFSVVAGKALTADLQVPENVGELNLPNGEIRDNDFYALQYAISELSNVFTAISQRGKTNDNTATDSAIVG